MMFLVGLFPLCFALCRLHCSHYMFSTTRDVHLGHLLMCAGFSNSSQHAAEAVTVPKGLVLRGGDIEVAAMPSNTSLSNCRSAIDTLGGCSGICSPISYAPPRQSSLGPLYVVFSPADIGANPDVVDSLLSISTVNTKCSIIVSTSMSRLQLKTTVHGGFCECDLSTHPSPVLYVLEPSTVLLQWQKCVITSP
ncbi:hypothetical protein R3P38DRAFT_1629423 [Favolaschia claudopus]|uniref:Uncharacterized protein n=1 Tax=Favolaschia claudopus TaxID=2862362 RepID=A0AAW0DK28_9AGAR